MACKLFKLLVVLTCCHAVSCASTPRPQPALFVPPQPDGTWQLVGLSPGDPDGVEAERPYERGRAVKMQACAEPSGQVSRVSHIDGGEPSSQASALAYARELRFDPQPQPFCKTVVVTLAWHAKNEDPPVLVRKTPIQVSAYVGMKRCLDCEMPRTATQQTDPAPFWLLQVCADEDGAVRTPPEVLQAGENPATLKTFRAAVQGWKFEPLAWWGVVMPYCFPLKVQG